MNALVLSAVPAVSIPVTMSSREIAELTGKDHRNVLADIRVMFEKLDVHCAEFSAQYKDSTGRGLPCFNLPKRETLILVSGYDVVMRAKIIDRWLELEAQVTLPSLPTLPVLEASLVLAFNGLPIRFLIDETGHWQATYRDVATALGYLTKEAQYNARNVLKFTVKPGERQLRHPLYGDLISLAGLERVLLRAEHYRATAPDRADAALELGYWLAEVAAPLVAHPAAAAALLSSPGRLDERRLALADDPDYQQTACILRLWHEALGETAYTAAEVLRLATGTFQEALIEIGRDRWFSDQLNAKRLGKWLAVRQGQPVAAFQLDSGVKSSSKVRWWAVLALGGDSP